MKCIIPKNSGFCFGVSLAVRAAFEYAGQTAYMYGEVVHNPAVVDELKSKGLPLIDSIDKLPCVGGGKVLIRAHGVSQRIIDEIADRGFEVIDKTCPKVKKIHNIVNNASIRGLDVIIVGKPNHPEVEGIVGWCSTGFWVFESLKDAKVRLCDIPFSDKGVCMVAQTTYNKREYEEIFAYCNENLKGLEFNDTICTATADRQDEIRRLAHRADAVIVIGGKKSSNVKKLTEIASEHCSNVLHIEDEKQLDYSLIKDSDIVVVASGASTPNRIVESVLSEISEYCKYSNIRFERSDGQALK